MIRFTLALVAVGMLAGLATAQEEGEHDERAEAIRAQARELLERAELALKRHDVAEAEKLLHRAVETDAPGEIGRHVFFRYVEVLVLKGEPEKALEVLRLFGEKRPVGEEVAEQLARTKTAVEAAIEARKLRGRARQARLNAMKAHLAAERAEARAHLLFQGMEPEAIENHLAQLETEHTRRLEQMRKEWRLWRRGRMGESSDVARSALEALLRAHGRTSDEAIEEAEERMRLVDEARKRYEEAVRHLEESRRTRDEVDRRRPRPGRGPGPLRRVPSIGDVFTERRLVQLERELAKAEAEHREEDARRLRADLEELMRDAALRSARAGRERNGLAARVDRIESEVREIRRLLEKLLDERK
jgi:hypothetical protein